MKLQTSFKEQEAAYKRKESIEDIENKRYDSFETKMLEAAAKALSKLSLVE